MTGRRQDPEHTEGLDFDRRSILARRGKKGRGCVQRQLFGHGKMWVSQSLGFSGKHNGRLSAEGRGLWGGELVRHGFRESIPHGHVLL